jgi:hypothetical protein
LWGHPRNRADSHTGGAANAHIGIILGPNLFHYPCQCSRKQNEEAQMSKSKCQINDK